MSLINRNQKMRETIESFRIGIVKCLERSANMKLKHLPELRVGAMGIRGTRGGPNWIADSAKVPRGASCLTTSAMCTSRDTSSDLGEFVLGECGTGRSALASSIGMFWSTSVFSPSSVIFCTSRAHRWMTSPRPIACNAFASSLPGATLRDSVGILKY